MRNLAVACRHLMRRDANSSGTGINRVGNDRVGANASLFADSDRSQYLRSGPDNDASSQGRMPLHVNLGPRIYRWRDAPQRDALVKSYIVTYLGCLANHHAGTVVDDEAPADAGAWVNLDRRDQPPNMGH